MTKTIIIDKEHPVKESYLKKINLVKVNDFINLEAETYEKYLKLKEYLKDKNINIDILKGYDESDKTSIFISGLAIGVKVSNPSFKDYLHLFGFILEDEASLIIRYVGEVPAKIIYENNYTLAEYLTNFYGVVAVNKPKGVTSFDVVNEISHLFGIKKVGHTGTLDPLACGVLLVAIGKATKVVELITSSYKEYIAEARLGIKTDTSDITGKVIEEKPYNMERLEEVLASYQKTYMQEVPMYSAVKVNGKKLYEYARNNIKITPPKKEVTIKEIELLEKSNDSFKFRTIVSKGCYIRSLIEDIGASLSTCATMTSLVRTEQANIRIENTNTIEEIKNNTYTIYKIEDLLDYDTVKVDSSTENKIRNGCKINNTYGIKNRVIFKNKEGRLLGIYEVEGQLLRVWKNF